MVLHPRTVIPRRDTQKRHGKKGEKACEDAGRLWNHKPRDVWSYKSWEGQG